MAITSFASLKRGRSAILTQLQQATQTINNPKFSSEDTRFWKPELDKLGNGYAVIRFLPIPKSDDFAYVEVFSYGFKGPGGWYIENSLKTIKQKDPVAEANSALWNSGVESDKEIARSRRLRTQFISNILVIQDPKHPENEGKVFLWKYGKRVYDKIADKAVPQFEGDAPMDPFDPWGGANFKLKIVKKDGYPNYDKSEFDAPSALFGGDDEKIEEIWNQEHSLKEFVDPAKSFKSYDELKARFEKVVGNSSAVPPASREESAPPASAPRTQRTAAPPSTPAAAAPEVGDKEAAPWEEDDADGFFDKLVNDDK